MQESMSEQTASPPVVGDIPFFGAAFRHNKQAKRKSELVILLKPLVVDQPDAWGRGLAGSAQRMKALDRGFHYGGKSEIFGTLGEVRD